MQFDQLRDEVERLLKFGGWLESDPAPDLGLLINEALRTWSWEAEYVTDTTTFTTTSGTAEYTLTNPPDWKLVKDVYYGTANELRLSSEDEERRRDPMYRINPNSTPERHWMPRPNVVRLYPTPSASSITIKVYGIRADTDLVNDTDTPQCPAQFHRGIALLAAYLHADLYALGEERDRIERWRANAYEMAYECRLFMAEQTTPVLQRHVRRRTPERINLNHGAWDYNVRSL